MCPWLFFQETWIENWYAHTHLYLNNWTLHIYYIVLLSISLSPIFMVHIAYFIFTYVHLYLLICGVFHRQHVSWSSIFSKVPPKARKASPSSCVEARFCGRAWGSRMYQCQRNNMKQQQKHPICQFPLPEWWYDERTWFLTGGTKKKSILATQQLRRKIWKFPALKSGRCSFPGV